MDLARSTRLESVTACREFPPDEFDTELVPGFMTFRKIHHHILDAGYALTGMLLDGQEHFNGPEMRKRFLDYVPVLPEEATPEELATALETRMDQRLTQFSEAGPAFWEREVTHFSGARVTMMEMLLLIRHHESGASRAGRHAVADARHCSGHHPQATRCAKSRRQINFRIRIGSVAPPKEETG